MHSIFAWMRKIAHHRDGALPKSGRDGKPKEIHPDEIEQPNSERNRHEDRAPCEHTSHGDDEDFPGEGKKPGTQVPPEIKNPPKKKKPPL